MGPSLSPTERTSPPQVRPPAPDVTLQWGRRFRRRKGSSHARLSGETFSLASMGPSAFADGKQRRDPSAAPASMGPPLRRRKVVSQAIRAPVASMGPSAFADGKGPCPPPCPGAAIASMGPSAFADGKAAIVPFSHAGPTQLQWGRQLSPTERTRSTPWRRPSRRFNGAVSFRRRKGGHVRRHLGLGHVAASMGPSAFADGKALLPSAQVHDRRLLQWGRQLSPTESCPRRCRPGFAARWLQWGRQLSPTERGRREDRDE